MPGGVHEIIVSSRGKDGRFGCVCGSLSALTMARVGVMVGWLLLGMTGMSGVAGHGALIDPPMRSYLWRVYTGPLNVVPNYNYNQLFCGGVSIKYYLISRIFAEIWI